MVRKRQVVCVQGLGYVGVAMALAIASARDERGDPIFDVIGVELPSEYGRRKIECINAGKLPFSCTDAKLEKALHEAVKVGNLRATSDPKVYSEASVIVVDIGLDVVCDSNPPGVDYSSFRSAIKTIGEHMQPGTLVVVETTVPPGTCENVVAPELRRCLAERGYQEDAFLLAHSFERVMPGKEYFDSIVNYWRVFSGHTSEAADACEAFLSKIINTEKYPLTRLQRTVESEMAKILENTYRAVNIAFIEEWTRFAEKAGADLYAVIDAIRIRPTHCNLREPGFGVGGYCLPKDPLLAEIGARDFFGVDPGSFPFSTKAVDINKRMPLTCLNRLKRLLGGNLKGKKILLLGVSYRADVGDTRNSPSQVFVEEAERAGAVVDFHDPLVRYWEEMERALPERLPSPDNYDAVVFAVAHEDYKNLNIVEWLGDARPVILDANRVLSPSCIRTLCNLGHRVYAIGRGDLR